MTIPKDIAEAALDCTSKFTWQNDDRWTDIVAEALLKERERCIARVMAATEPGERAPASHFAAAIRAE